MASWTPDTRTAPQPPKRGRVRIALWHYFNPAWTPADPAAEALARRDKLTRAA